MKKKILKINMPSPCETSVTEMFQVLDGKFCKGCKRIVVDFRKMSDKQLLDYFSEHHGKICGEFRPYQLGREITMNIPSGMDMLRQKTVAVATIASLAVIVPVSQMQAQINHEITEQPLRGKINPEALSTENQNNSDTEKKIVGTVEDENGKLIPQSIVSVYGTSIEAVTDLHGYFELYIQVADFKNSLINIQASYAGLETITLEINPLAAIEPLKIVLKAPRLRGDISVAGGISFNPRNETHIINPVEPKKIDPILERPIDSMSIFPNPSSGSFHVKAILLKKDQYELFIFDETGKVYWTEFKKLNKGLNEFDIKLPEHLSAGSYIFHLRSKEMQLSEILMKAE